jgi:hypothetical protein
MESISGQMKTIKSKSLICILAMLSAVHLTIPISGLAAGDLHPEFEIPVFQGGYNISREMNSHPAARTITYSVHIKNPAAEIIEFYDAYLNGRGWISSFEICQRQWTESADETGTGGLAARQMFASWAHPDLNLKLDLWLKHASAENQHQSVVVVKGSLQPLADN